jgi:hypothetical protein
MTTTSYASPVGVAVLNKDVVVKDDRTIAVLRNQTLRWSDDESMITLLYIKL